MSFRPRETKATYSTQCGCRKSSRELVRGPLPKAHGYGAAHSEAQGQDHVEVVEFHLANDLAVALFLNCSE